MCIPIFCKKGNNLDKSNSTCITDKKMGWDNSWQAWITDPNGIKIELHQYTDKSSQIVGSDCVI